MDVIYMDFMKAFDKVPHLRLLVKFQSYSICSKTLDWIKQQSRATFFGRGPHWYFARMSGTAPASLTGISITRYSSVY